MVRAGDANGYRCGGLPICNTKTLIDHIANRSAADPASRTQEYNLKRHIEIEYISVTCSPNVSMLKNFT
jgi:hypothetical protein